MKITKIIIPNYVTLAKLHHKVILKDFLKGFKEIGIFFFFWTDFYKIENVTCARKLPKSE